MLKTIQEQLLPHDCPKCAKATRNFFGFAAIMLSAAFTALGTAVIFWVGGEYAGLPLNDLQTGVKIVAIFSMTAFLWWVYWQFDKMVCSCDEKGTDEDWLGV